MKVIPPTARERRRYLLVAVEAEEPLTKTMLENSITNAGLQFLGELGMAEAGLLMLGETWDGRKVVLRTGHKFVDETKAALSLIKEIDNKKVRLSVVKVSGSLKKIKKEV